jgi:RHS repeat-associated protein
LRIQSVTAKNGATTLQSATYGYDTAGRLQTVSDSPYSAAYTYQANSALINTITFTNSGAAGMVTTRTYDKLNRLQRISSVSSASSAVSFLYQYSAANQRTRATLNDGSYWVYQYDALGQVISGCRFWADGTPVAGQDFSYAFDDIGNRTTTGGRPSAASTYTVNRLNQYSSRTVAPYVDVLGVANPTTNVTVNGNTANRKGEHFHWPLNVPNTSAQYTNLTIVSQYGATQTQTGAVYVAASTESFQPDADGNLISDGRWTYTWDGENRLIQMIRDTDTPAGARQKLVFEYDHQGRRIRKQFFTYSGGWQEQTDAVFLYDGWNLVAELNANSSNAKIRSYVWGSDLSGSLQGAGGVGGLLKVTYVGASTTNAFVPYDGNGNVSALVDAANGSTCARYEYGPFAEPVRISGTLGKANPIRFSSKYADDECDLLYYGFRYYSPLTGRWLSRDPVSEATGRSLYCHTENDLLDRIDLLGLDSSTIGDAVIVGPRKIKVLDKAYPSIQTTDYSYLGRGVVCRWSVRAHLAINGPDDQNSVTVHPTSESQARGDAPLTAITSSGKYTKYITVVRPKRASRNPSLTPRTWTFPGGIVGWRLDFKWHIEDQLGDPFANAPIGEKTADIERHLVLSFAEETSTGWTDANGDVPDTYRITFWASSGYRFFSQDLLIGNWVAAGLINREFGDGTFSGTASRSFQ